MRLRLRLVVSLLSWLTLSAAAQDTMTLEPSELHLSVGEKKTLTIAPAGAQTGMTFAFDKDFVKLDTTTLTVTGHAPGTTTVVGRKGGKETNSVTVVVTAVTLKAPALEAPLIQGEKRDFTLEITNEDGEPVELSPTVKSSNASVARMVGNGTVEATATSRGDTTTRLTVTANGETLGSLEITVREAIASIRVPPTFNIEEGKEAIVPVRLVGARGSEFTPEERSIEGTAVNTNLVRASGNILQAGDLPASTDASTDVTFSTTEGAGNNKRIESKTTVTVHVRAGRLEFNPPGGIVPRNGSISVTAKLRSRAGEVQEITKINWMLKSPGDAEYVRLVQSGPSVLVLWNDKGPEGARPSLIEIDVSAHSAISATPITDTLVMQMVTGGVAPAAALTVQLNIMDDVTARDLYGKHTAEEYFVTRIRLNNNLDEGKPELQGASILAFSESIEVAVRYQKRPIDSKGKPTGDWADVTAEDVGFVDMEPNYETATVRTRPVCQGFFTYRPYMLEMMVNTGDRRDERSPRTRTFRTMSAIGTIASFITSVAVPGPQSDIPLGIEKFTSLLIPGIEKLWPNLRETHRQNLISQTMKNIEEIPAGSDLSRVLFFPKRSFRGLVQNHETRVSQICPYRFDIEVAVINKKTPVKAAIEPIQ